VLSRVGRKSGRSASDPSTHEEASRSQGRWLTHLFPVLVSVLVVSVTLLVTIRILYRQDALDHERFHREANKVLETLTMRVRYQERLLDAVAGFYTVAPNRRLTPPLWYRFIHQLAPLAHSPFLVAVMHIRAPSGANKPKCIVNRYWPKDVADKVVGVDACSNKYVRPLLLNASPHDSVRSSLPFPVWNLHDKPTLGVALVRDITTPGRDSLPSGWVVLILSLRRLVQRLGADRRLRIRLVPPSRGIGPSQGRSFGRRARSGGMFVTDLHRVRALLIGGRLWHVDFERRYRVGTLPYVVLACGIFVALLVYGLAFLAVRTRERARVLAERMSERLQRNLDLLRSITDNVSEGIYRSHPDKGVLFCNKALAHLFGYPNVHDLLHVDPARLYVHPERRRELLALLVRDKSYRRIEVEMQRRGGERFVALESAQATFGTDGKILYIDGVITDVTSLRQAESRAAYLDQYDKHTGLPNRTLARDRIHQAVEVARRGESLAVVIDFDLDRFIAVNDLHGQEVGDRLLLHLGRNLLAIGAPHVSVARVGEDEFLAVANVPERNYSEILLFLERLQSAVSDAYRAHAPDVGGTAAMGVSLLPGDSRTADDLILHAGAALREAKNRAPGSVVFYSAEAHALALNETKLVHRLRNLLAEDRFSVAFQPIVAFDTGRVVSLEALARWPHDALPVVSPDVFVPLAERLYLAGRMEETIWRRAFQVWTQWRTQPWAPASLSVNVSLQHLIEEGFERRFFDLLNETGMPARELVVELTETYLLQNQERLREILTRLAAHGIRIAVDDFGTGYSGLSLLHTFPVSIIKLDRSCVDNVADDPNTQVIARAVAGLAQDLSLDLVAEGVERAVDRDVLVGLGYKRFQGFLYAPPLAADDLVAFASSAANRPAP
jgi:diguanylate cyclase (GGDEF)-like protein/PAS domain S-box-containing protein